MNYAFFLESVARYGKCCKWGYVLKELFLITPNRIFNTFHDLATLSNERRA